MANYILVTNFYNERREIPRIVKNINQQTKKPNVWVLIDDGSLDGSANVFQDLLTELRIAFKIVSLEKKAHGDLDTIGRAWNEAQPVIRKLLNDVSYMAITDVDIRFPPDYFEKGIKFLEEHPDYGVIAGKPIWHISYPRSFPQGGGKIVRANVIKRIHKYWDIAPDSFINVKALLMGYKIGFLNIIFRSPLTHLFSVKGRFRSGRLAYYTGITPYYAILKAILKRDFHYIQGYWYEWSRGIWQCQDDEVSEWYGQQIKRRIMNMISRI